MHRRRFLTGSAALGGTLLAGCTGTDTDPNDQSEGGSTPNSEGTSTPGSEETSTPEEQSSYSVSIEPVGEVTFDEVPETWVANNGSWADMGVALGLEPPKGVWLTSRYHTQYYDEIPGVSVDKSGMVDLYSDGVSKELFYQLDGDVHVIDPNFLMNRFKGWEQSDVDEIRENVGPFFGNSIFSTGYTWHEDYQYYTLYEAFEKLAAVFQRQDRYAAFESLHGTFQSDLDAVVPDTGPSGAVLWAGGDQPESFSPYIIEQGTSFKHLRDLNVADALANTDVKDFHSNRGSIDFETLLEVDPDVLLLRGQEAKTAEEFQNTTAQFVEDHSVGSELTAAQNGDIYRAGGLYQGPITNLVLTERLAVDLYDVEEDLFDRQRVADIVDGDI
jgi:iron complex transport system substrate-binding protein